MEVTTCTPTKLLFNHPRFVVHAIKHKELKGTSVTQFVIEFKSTQISVDDVIEILASRLREFINVEYVSYARLPIDSSNARHVIAAVYLGRTIEPG